jgi:indole-3-glycerol phosphate synthase
MSKLREIFLHKRSEVERAKLATPLPELQATAADADRVRPFKAALERATTPLALIAEVKQASPSKGLIRPEFDPEEVAVAYKTAGAHCLSVLTDERYFQGSRENLKLAREASGLPCLRKDFIYDPYQIYEARAWGADCVLLIVAGFLPPNWIQEAPAKGLEALRELWRLAKELGMDVLVEVHSADEVDIALELGADLIGVNNRNLSDMTTDLATSEELLPMLAQGAFAVSESALRTPEDLDRAKAAGAKGVLIGSTFCEAMDIGAKVREVMGW